VPARADGVGGITGLPGPLALMQVRDVASRFAPNGAAPPAPPAPLSSTPRRRDLFGLE